MFHRQLLYRTASMTNYYILLKMYTVLVEISHAYITVNINNKYYFPITV